MTPAALAESNAQTEAADLGRLLVKSIPDLTVECEACGGPVVVAELNREERLNFVLTGTCRSGCFVEEEPWDDRLEEAA